MNYLNLIVTKFIVINFMSTQFKFRKDNSNTHILYSFPWTKKQNGGMQTIDSIHFFYKITMVSRIPRELTTCW